MTPLATPSETARIRAYRDNTTLRPEQVARELALPIAVVREVWGK